MTDIAVAGLVAGSAQLQCTAVLLHGQALERHEARQRHQQGRMMPEAQHLLLQHMRRREQLCLAVVAPQGLAAGWQPLEQAQERPSAVRRRHMHLRNGGLLRYS